MTIAGLILVDLALIALLDAVVVRPVARRLRGRLGARRLGRLPAAPTAEAARRARLLQLGEAGTYKVYNCGTILDVDYERGVLICERETRHRR